MRQSQANLGVFAKEGALSTLMSNPLRHTHLPILGRPETQTHKTILKSPPVTHLTLVSSTDSSCYLHNKTEITMGSGNHHHHDGKYERSNHSQEIKGNNLFRCDTLTKIGYPFVKKFSVP